MKKKLRISYSLLRTFKAGKIEEAIALYLHHLREKTEQQQYGLDFEKRVCKSALDTHILEVGQSRFQLHKPEYQKVITVSYNDLWDIKVIYDLFDTDIIYELKTGETDSKGYAYTDQLPIYFLVAEMFKLPVKQGIILHYDRNTDKDDFYVVWNNEEIRNRAKRLIESTAPDIYKCFDERGILKLKT